MGYLLFIQWELILYFSTLIYLIANVMEFSEIKISNTCLYFFLNNFLI